MRPLSYARHRVTGTRNRAACIIARHDVKFINAVVQLILPVFRPNGEREIITE